MSSDIFERSSSRKKDRSLRREVRQINKEYEWYSYMLKRDASSDEVESFFKTQTENLRSEVKAYMSLGYSEDDALKRILPKAYGLVKLASGIKLGKTYYDVQLMGGILLNDGYVSEMATGEGKTITAALPTYLNALLGKGAHVITPNAYLARRDFIEMRPLYELLGLSCGLVEEVKPSERREKIKERQKVLFNQRLSTLDLRGLTESEIYEKRLELAQKCREDATILYEQEELSAKQEAYSADVTYGSSNAFAFDYLFDGLEKDPTKVRARRTEPNFLVIDEADEVLFDDAVTPFTLSGSQEDEELAIDDETVSQREQATIICANVMQAIYDEDKYLRAFLRRRNPDRTPLKDDGILYEVSDPLVYDQIVTGEVDKSVAHEYTQAIIYCPKTKDTHLTTLGEVMFYYGFKRDEVDRVINENKSKILRMQYNGKPMFRRDLDYTEIDGRIYLSSRALTYLIDSNQSIPELRDSFNSFMDSEFIENYEDIKNSITAWVTLELDKDYKYTRPKNSKNPNEIVLSLIMGGRTAEGRVYSKGLQQAIEKKETLKLVNQGSPLFIRETKFKDTLASIPAVSFFGRYKKFSGMTGTSAVGAFRRLYNLETYKVPRNKTKQVRDHGDRLYRTTAQKNRAILMEVVKSHRKGQPILLTTTSVEESKKIHDYLINNLPKYGINIDIPVLNADIDDLEREAEIIAGAGKKGAITISTEMAGRGTDIKLGGAEPTEEEIERYSKEISKSRFKRYAKIMGPANAALKINSDTEKENIRAEAIRLLEVSRKREEQEVMALGGLKIIGSGHFRYSRVDDQVKGRCGRQGNPGEVVFFNDLYDLRNLGVKPGVLKRLSRKLKIGPIVEKETDDKTPLGDIIREAQDSLESRTESSISQSEKSEIPAAKCRDYLRRVSDSVKLKNNYVDEIDYIMERTSKDILVAASKKLKTRDDVSDNKKLSRAKLDMDYVRELSQEFLGVNVTTEMINKCNTAEDLANMIYRSASTKLQVRTIIEGKDKVEARARNILNTYLNRTAFDFNDKVEQIKRQRTLSSLIQGNNVPEDLTSYIVEAFDYCYQSSLAQAVREVANPKANKKHYGLTDMVIGSDCRIERVSHKEGKRIHDEEERIIEETRKAGKAMNKSRITKVNIPYFITIVKEKLKVNKGRPKDQGKKSRSL